MGLLQTNQNAKIVFDAELKTVELDCVIDEVLSDRIRLILSKSFMRYIDYLMSEQEVIIKVFTTAGVFEFHSLIISSPLEDFFEVEYDENTIQLEMNYSVKIKEIDNLTIKRPLLGDINTRVASLERTKLTFYSITPVFVNSIFDFVMTIHEDEIEFSGRVINANESNCYTVIIEKMSNSDSEKYLEFLNQLKKE